MSAGGEAAGRKRAEAALGLVGSPFRWRGRDPDTGLDCVGVIACALRGANEAAAVPQGYRLRLRDPAAWLDWAESHGWSRRDDDGAGVGDVVVCGVGPGQLHLGIVVGGGAVVHAHAGLRRVVRARLPGEWAVIGHWRPVPGADGEE